MKEMLNICIKMQLSKLFTVQLRWQKCLKQSRKFVIQKKIDNIQYD